MGIDIDAYNWLNHNQLGYDIWNNKYRWKNESFDEWLDRVSGGDVEVKEIIRERKFLFGGRILANRGLENEGRKLSRLKTQLSQSLIQQRSWQEHIPMVVDAASISPILGREGP